MKKIIFTALVSLAIVGFTGCTTGEDADVATKCSASGKCATSKKCVTNGKCTGNKAKDVAKKCSSSGKCAVGKCGK